MWGNSEMSERYSRLPDDQLKAILDSLKNCIESYLFKMRKFPLDLVYDVSPVDLIDIIIQVDKRNAHYLYFHKGMHINEAKKIGLYAYWFLKFKPIRILDPRFRTTASIIDINECFALCLLYSVLRSVGRHASFIRGGQPLWKELQYSLRCRTFTAGSMMVLADSFQ
jgi:hypothetical protein